MRGITRKIAISLALAALVITGVATSAEARGGGTIGAAAAKMSRGAQLRLNRMKAKMALRPRGAQQQKSRRQLRLGKRQLMRAMSRREVGLKTSEVERTRAAFARDSGFKPNDVTPDQLDESSGARQSKKMRERARRAMSERRKRRR